MAKAAGTKRNIRVVLTERGIKSLKSAKSLKPPKARYYKWDALVPKFAVRVTDKGHKTYSLVARFPGSTNPIPRALGEVGAITLEEAREKARQWIALIKAGKDPAIEEQRKREAEQRKQKNTFRAVAEAWFADPIFKIERKAAEVERDVRREFFEKWGSRPITEISSLDVRAAIKKKAATAPAQARNNLGHLKRLFKWAKNEEVYGLTASPAAEQGAKTIVGKKKTGVRVLDDYELFALWRAAGRLGYPHGPIYKILTLTGLRLNEVADARWREFDIDGKKFGFDGKKWIIPAERMKGTEATAKAHAVPLTADLLSILESLPRFKRGEYLFSTTFGEKPVWVSDKVKARLDARMLRTLRALARRRGDDPRKVELPHWQNHDIRRSARSRLSSLKVAEEVREAVLAHVRPGIKKHYDLHVSIGFQL